MFLVCERWVGDGDRLLHIDTKFFWPWQHFFVILAGLLNRVSWGPKPSVWSWFSLRGYPISNWNCNSNSNWPKPSVAPGYIIVCRPPASCGCKQLHWIQPRPQVKVIFWYLRPDAPVSAVPLLIYTGASLDWRLGRGSICYIPQLRVNRCTWQGFLTLVRYQNLGNVKLWKSNKIKRETDSSTQCLANFYE